MKKFYTTREKLSIKAIGVLRFWIGLALGLFMATLLFLALIYFTQLLDYVAISENYDFLFEQVEEVKIINYFFSALAVVLGLNYCVAFWMSKMSDSNKHIQRRRRFISTSLFFSFWIILFVFAKFSISLKQLVGHEFGYNDLFDSPQFTLFLWVFPMVIFLNIWYNVRLIYKSTRWILFSLMGCFVIAFVFLKINPVKPNMLHEIYLSQLEEELSFIEKTLHEAETKYGIVFSDQTIKNLKQENTQASLHLTDAVTLAFERNAAVSLDTIFLERIIVHNLKDGTFSYNRFRSSKPKFKYAHPQDILKQLKKVDPASNQAKELLLIYDELFQLAFQTNLSWTDLNLSRYQMKHLTLISDLEYFNMYHEIAAVKDSLIQDSNFNVKYPEVILPPSSPWMSE